MQTRLPLHVPPASVIGFIGLGAGSIEVSALQLVQVFATKRAVDDLRRGGSPYAGDRLCDKVWLWHKAASSHSRELRNIYSISLSI